MNTPTQNSTARAPFATGVYAPAEDDQSRAEAARAESLRAELRALRTTVARLASRDTSSQLEQLQRMVEELQPPPNKARALNILVERCAIEGRAAATLKRAVTKSMKDAGEGGLDAAWTKALSGFVRVAQSPLAAESAVIALVGPSGVGKTTTSAKLAARAIAAGRTVTLVACDHFRVGAAHQLGRYADLMGARFAKAATERELEDVVANATTNIVILDTAGVMPADAAIGRVMANARRTTYTLLCMPASVRAHDAAFIAKQFAQCNATSLCITKLDETEAPAGLAHGIAGAELPISTLCNGPRVPDDIAAANATAVVDLIARRKS